MGTAGPYPPPNNKAEWALATAFDGRGASFANPPIATGAAFPADRADSLFRLDLCRLGGLVRNGEIRKCALVLGADPLSPETAHIEFYRSDAKRPIVMLRALDALNGDYEVGPRDRAVLARLARIPALDPFTQN